MPSTSPHSLETPSATRLARLRALAPWLLAVQAIVDALVVLALRRCGSDSCNMRCRNPYRWCTMDTVVLWRPGGASALTPLQREIVRLIANGCTNARIAEQLGMSPGNVGTHVGRIVEWLGLDCRADIARWAVTWWRRPSPRHALWP